MQANTNEILKNARDALARLLKNNLHACSRDVRAYEALTRLVEQRSKKNKARHERQ